MDFDFDWIHISDLHAGMAQQNLLWSTVKHAIFDDLKRQFGKSGKCDVVIFSGDVSQSGSHADFESAREILEELWEQFGQIGVSPSLFVAPGNHDVARPPAKQAQVLLLGRWFEEEAVRDGFFEGPSEYRDVVDLALINYRNFVANLPSNIPQLAAHSGLLPGDQVALFEKPSGRAGIVSLNSTWLQLTANDARGHLHVDLQQLHALLPDAESWCRANDLNILVTHHPTSWFHSSSMDNWLGEISPAGRFDLHLFGHMHEPQMESNAQGGSPARNDFQGASLFGLEYLGDGSSKRIHGYSFGHFQKVGTARELRFWPRIGNRLASGGRNIVPDNRFSLPDGQSFQISLPPKTVEAPHTPPILNPLPQSTEAQSVLSKVDFKPQHSRPHMAVRLAEQEQCLGALAKDRCVWLIAEWGLAEDQFAMSVLTRRGINRLFRIDLSELATQETINDRIAARAGCSVEEFCERLADAGAAAVFFDDITLPTDSPRESGLRDTLDVLLGFCPDLIVFLRARRAPKGSAFDVVQLKPLDEGDLRSYLAAHETTPDNLLTQDAIEMLFRHTDGFPTRVDNALKELEVVSLSELVSGDAGSISMAPGSGDAPIALHRAVGELSGNEDRAARRSFDLLQALALFPQGMQLSKIKRFNGVHAFYPRNALALVDRALAVVADAHLIGDDADPGKLLIVPRPVRDVLWTMVSEEDLANLHKRAAEIFFGPDWMTGSTHWPSAYNYSSPECPAADIANAGAIIHRLLRIAQHTGNDRELETAVNLGASFADSLLEGSHYHYALAFCNDFLPLVDSERFPERRANLALANARALRMLGARDRAKELFLEIRDYPFGADKRQSLFVNLALCDELSDRSAAIAAAREALKIDRHTYLGMQATSIVLDLTKDDPERKKKLLKLENLARKKGAYVVANNIALTRAKEEEDSNAETNILNGIVAGGRKSKDFYNVTRATIEMADNARRDGRKLSEAEQLRLIGCYQFLFTERMANLFDRCHGNLWDSFADRLDVENLLALFRHSSLVWRLRGADQIEKRYAQKLADLLHAHPSLQREGTVFNAYFRARQAFFDITPKTDDPAKTAMLTEPKGRAEDVGSTRP